MKFTATVFLNREEDEEGRLAIFSRLRSEGRYQPGDALESVLVLHDIEAASAKDVCEIVYGMTNRGSPTFVGDERYPQRSLSCGDIVEIHGGAAFVCESVGFEPVEGFAAEQYSKLCAASEAAAAAEFARDFPSQVAS